MANVLVAHESPGTGQLIGDALKQAGHQITLVTQSGTQAVDQASGAELAYISINLPDLDGLSVIRSIKSSSPQLPIIPVFSGSEGGDIWQQILQLNLRDVLVNPTQADQVVDAANKAFEHSHDGGEYREGESQSYVVSVASARGGVGKTIFAVNLAICMAQQHADLCLVDYSMSSGDFFTTLDQVPRNTLQDAISQGQGIDDILLRNLISEHPMQFSYLACPNDDFDFYSFDYESATSLIAAARSIKPYVVIDTGVYDLPPTNAAVENSDLVYFITSRDLGRLMSLQKLIKSYADRDIPADKFKVIVNMAEWGTEITEDEIEEVIEHPVTAYLPSIPIEATYSINSGKPLAQANADLPIVSVMHKLAEYTISQWSDV
jgi:pilus assembly protein CpaE